MQLFLTLGFLLLTLLSFQNCSKVGFGNGSKEVHSKSGDDTSSPGSSNEDEVIDEVVSRNEACDPIFDGNSATDLMGASSFFNGSHDHLILKNGGHLVVNGTSNKLSVDGSSSVSVNGVHKAICLKSEFFLMNGSYGSSGAPIVLVGKGDNAILGVLNGDRSSDLVLINIKDVGVINGHNADVYIYGSEVQIINGAGQNIHLMAGAKVHHLNGHFGKIHLYGNSSLGSSNGNSEIIRH